MRAQAEPRPVPELASMGWHKGDAVDGEALAAQHALWRLDGRCALVTGAAQGLGAAIATGLAQAGAAVVLLDHSPAVHATAQQLAAHGLQVWSQQADVRDEAQFAAAFASAVTHFGAIDVMVNNAALTSNTSLWDLDLAQWDAVMAVNLRGCFVGCRLAGAHLRERVLQERAQGAKSMSTGRILNLTSLAGQQASSATGVHYAASKAGILALTRSFAQELAPLGICVNALAPAAIESPALQGLSPEQQQKLQASIPLGRFGRAQEVASAVVYLASEAGAFITGATLDINGGRLMR